MTHRFAFFVLAFVLGARLALAQGLGAPTAAPDSQALQLPLSGRTGQSGSVNAVQSAVPGVTTSVNTLNTSVQVQGPFQGSALGADDLAGGTLSLRDAVKRGLEFNLGRISQANAVSQARGQTQVARSRLLPNVSGTVREVVQQTNLAALGVRIPFGPTVVGPFNYFDARANLTQTIADFTLLNNHRAAQANSEAVELAIEDARDLVTFAVAGVYLQTLAASARLEAAQAQVETAKALLAQTESQRLVGFVAQIDVNRRRVETQTQQQRVATLQNDLAKQKINLARLIGLPPGANFTLSDSVTFSAAPELTPEKALASALQTRADLRSAEAQVRAAERSVAAARAERLPSLAVAADYGAIGTNPSRAHSTFSVSGSVRFPIWEGGRISGAIQQARAALEQRRAEAADVRGRIEAEVSTAFLDIQAAADQVRLATANLEVTRNDLELTRQRVEVGVTNAVELVGAQESLATANLDYITALFAHNLAKLTLARSLGRAEDNLSRFLNVP
ncbi:MAG TPA: TolC family protein [Bryobacteraceae bacterium]|nr:TolC family protein [Bryobacteraceae bacterium]